MLVLLKSINHRNKTRGVFIFRYVSSLSYIRSNLHMFTMWLSQMIYAHMALIIRQSHIKYVAFRVNFNKPVMPVIFMQQIISYFLEIILASSLRYAKRLTEICSPILSIFPEEGVMADENPSFVASFNLEGICATDLMAPERLTSPK